nr:hypothetical protein [Tanacetum cinerariifolium]
KLVIKQSRQQMHISQASSSSADEGTGFIPRLPDVSTDESKEELSWNSTDDESADEEGKDGDDDDEDEGNDGKEGNCDEDDDGEDGDDDDDDQEVVKNGEKDDAEESGDDDEEGKGDEQEYDEEDDTYVTLTPVKPDGQQESSSVSSQFLTSMLNLTLDAGMESIFETTSRIDVQTPTFVAPLPITTPTMTSSTIAATTTTSQAPILPTTIPSDII